MAASSVSCEHVPVVDCAYGYQKENQEEADESEENGGQEGDADEDG